MGSSSATTAAAAAAAAPSSSGGGLGLGGFLLLNAGLAALSFLAFLCPSRLRLEDRNMALGNAMSCGVLVGCVLGIILPEGFGAIHEAAGSSGSEWSGLPLLAGYVVQVLLDLAGQRLAGGGAAGGGHHHHHHYRLVAAKQSPRPHDEGNGDEEGLEDEGEDEEAAACVCPHDDDEEEEEVGGLGHGERRGRRSGLLRPSLDAAPTIELPVLSAGKGMGPPRSPTAAAAAGGGGGGSITSRSPRRHSSVASLDSQHARPPVGATHYGHAAHRRSLDQGGAPRTAAAACSKCPFSSDFLGLLVHCAADGVALGASSLSASAALRGSVFFALTLHKLPVAFATGAFVHHALLSRGPTSTSTSSSRGRGQQRRGQGLYLSHALAFALASPAAALLTHGAAGRLLGGRRSSGGQAVGGLLLFSGGSFLYVAVGHIAPEILHSPAFHRPGPQGWLLLLLLLLGMALVPLLAALAPEGGEGGKGHGH